MEPTLISLQPPFEVQTTATKPEGALSGAHGRIEALFHQLGGAAINKKDTSARAVGDPSEQPSPGRSTAHLHFPLASCSAPFFKLIFSERERNLMEKAVD